MKSVVLFSQSAKPEFVESEINDRSCVERKKLAHDEAADDADAEGAAKFGTGAGAEGQRESAKEGGHGGHQDGAEAQHARFEDGVFGAFAAFAFGLQGKINHHDGVFLDDTDEQDDADDGNDVEVLLEEHESEHGADAGGGKRGNDGQRMHETFVKDAENDVDRQESGEDQDGFGAQGLLVSQQGGRDAHTLFHLFDGESGVAERDAGSQIERDGDGGK